VLAGLFVTNTEEVLNLHLVGLSQWLTLCSLLTPIISVIPDFLVDN
jgi:hypothetical protein